MLQRIQLDALKVQRPDIVALALAVCFGAACGKRPDGLHRDSRPVVDPTHQRAIILAASVMGKSSIYRLHTDDLSSELLVSSEGDNVQPTVSQDGSLIAYVCEQPSGAGRICVVNSEGANNRAVTSEHDVDERWPAFLSRDHIVFARAAQRRSYSMGGHVWDDYDLYDASLSLRTVTRLTHESYRQVLGISSDDGEIVFSAQPSGGDLTVFKMRLNGEAKPVVDGSYPAVGRSSRTLFVRRTAAKEESDYFEYEVWLEQNGLRQLTHNRSYDLSPTWGEGADSVLYLSDPDRNQRCTLWESDLAGSRPHQIPVTVASLRLRR